MPYTTKKFEDLVGIFNCKSKKELLKYSNNIVVHQKDFVQLILAAQSGDLSPYIYANHFDKRIPEHLIPNEEEREAFSENGVGAYKTRKAQKFANKIFNFSNQQRVIAAHLFYTYDHQYWYLFYFDDKDRLKYNNHWQYGPHIHCVSDLLSNLSLSDVWEKVYHGEFSFRNKLHLRYINN